MTDIVMITFLTYNNYFYIVVLVGKGTHTQCFIHYKVCMRTHGHRNLIVELVLSVTLHVVSDCLLYIALLV